MRLRAPNLPLTVVVLTWGFNFVAVKAVYHDMSPPALALIRFFVMCVVLVGFCLARRETLRYGADWLQVLFSGFISMGVYMILFLEGMSATTPAAGSIMLATSPVLTYLFAVFLRNEPFRPVALLGGLTAFVGVAIVILGGTVAGHGTLRGNLTVLASAAIWAIAAVIMRPLLKRHSPTALLTMSMPGALVALLPYGWQAASHVSLGTVTPYGWLMFFHVAVLSGVVGFALFYEGIRQVGPSRATMYQFYVPIAATTFAWIMFGQALTMIQFLGLVTVIVGVVVTARGRVAAPIPEGPVLVSEGNL